MGCAAMSAVRYLSCLFLDCFKICIPCNIPFFVAYIPGLSNFYQLLFWVYYFSNSAKHIEIFYFAGRAKLHHGPRCWKPCYIHMSCCCNFICLCCHYCSTHRFGLHSYFPIATLFGFGGLKGLAGEFTDLLTVLWF